MSPIAGKPVYPEFAEFDSSSPSSSTTPTPSSSTMAILMDSRNMSYSTKSNFGTLRHPASSTTMRPSIFTPYNSSWLMSLTQISPQGPSVFSNPDSNTPTTYGHSFTRYWDDSTPHHTNLNSIATSSHALMLPPRQSEPDSRKSDSSHPPSRGVPFPSPQISIYVDEPFPFIRFQSPFSIPFCIDFPDHSGPPFVRVQTDPIFDGFLDIQVHIRKIIPSSTSTLSSFSDKTFLSHPSYVFLIHISPRNTTDHPFLDNPGICNIPSTSDNFRQLSSPSSSS